VGSDGSIYVGDPWHCKVPDVELRRSGEVELVDVGRGDSYRLELENLSDAIRGDGEPLLGRGDALGQVRAIEALYGAAER
jgi:predicted dehydrogenase